MAFETNRPIAMYLRTGTETDPFVFIEETDRKVSDRGIIVLQEIPTNQPSYSYITGFEGPQDPVAIEVSTTVNDIKTIFTEVKDPSVNLQQNQYRVDYIFGILSFDIESHAGQENIDINYVGKGAFLISASRIFSDTDFTQDGGELPQTLQDILNSLDPTFTISKVYADSATRNADTTQDPGTLSITQDNAEVAVFQEDIWNVIGFTAIEGPQGPKGNKGDKGDKGDHGDKGDQGDSISLKGSVQSEANLTNIIDPEIGDIYVIIDSGDGFIWDGSTWNNVGPIRGPQGIQGIEGPQGNDGTSVVIQGSVAEITDLDNIVDPNPGDLYIVIDNGDGYVWDGDSWNNVGPIQGPIGPEGPQGPQGIQGIPGDDGTDGADGSDGQSVRLQGSVSELIDLEDINSPEFGDLYIVLNNGNGYVYNEAQQWKAFTETELITGYYSYNNVVNFLTAYATPETFTIDKIIYDLIDAPTTTGARWDLQLEEFVLDSNYTEASTHPDDTIIYFVSYETIQELNQAEGAPIFNNTTSIWFEAVGEGIRPSNWYDVGQIRGPEGPQGLTGPQGESISLKGVIQLESDLDNIQDPEIGDIYVFIETGDGFIWDGESWNNIGQIRGPQGLTGPQGESFRLKGSVAIESDLDNIQDPEIGDVYVVTDTGFGFIWNGSVWNNIGLIRGPQGIQGDDADVPDFATQQEAEDGTNNTTIMSPLRTAQAITAAQLSLGKNYSVANLTERDNLTNLVVGDIIFVADNGDGKWAQYKVSVASPNAEFIQIMDEDVFLNALSATDIKDSYESNTNTNAFTDAEQTKLSNLIVPFDKTYTTGPVTLNATDIGAIIQINSSSNITVNIPNDTSPVTFPNGTEIAFLRMGTGEVIFSPGGSVTLNSEDAKRKIKSRYGGASIRKLSANNWILVGNLET